MKRNLLTTALALFLICSGAVQAQSLESSFEFLRLPVSAHNSSLGGRTVSVFDPGTTLFITNPALLSANDTRLLGLNGFEQGSVPYKLVANIGNAAAWVLAVLFAYITNKKYVFQSNADARTGAWREFWLFVSARAASLVIFDLALFNLFLLLGMNADWHKLLMNALVILFNYFASKLVIFRKTGGGEERQAQK